MIVYFVTKANRTPFTTNAAHVALVQKPIRNTTAERVTTICGIEGDTFMNINWFRPENVCGICFNALPSVLNHLREEGKKNGAV